MSWNLPLDEYCPRVITHLSVASYLSGFLAFQAFLWEPPIGGVLGFLRGFHGIAWAIESKTPMKSRNPKDPAVNPEL